MLLTDAQLTVCAIFVKPTKVSRQKCLDFLHQQTSNVVATVVAVARLDLVITLEKDEEYKNKKCIMQATICKLKHRFMRVPIGS